MSKHCSMQKSCNFYSAFYEIFSDFGTYFCQPIYTGTFCNKTFVPFSQHQCCQDSAQRMKKRHMYTNTARWGEGENTWLKLGYWITHVILYTNVLIMFNVVVICRACVTTSVLYDCMQLMKKIRYRSQKFCHIMKTPGRICMIFAGNIVFKWSPYMYYYHFMTSFACLLY